MMVIKNLNWMPSLVNPSPSLNFKKSYKTKSTAFGLDYISYSLIDALPINEKELFLSALNQIWLKSEEVVNLNKILKFPY